MWWFETTENTKLLTLTTEVCGSPLHRLFSSRSNLILLKICKFFWFTDITREFFFCHVVNWVRLSCQKAIGIFLLGQKIMDGLQGEENSTMTTGRSYIVLFFFNSIGFLPISTMLIRQKHWFSSNCEIVIQHSRKTKWNLLCVGNASKINYFIKVECGFPCLTSQPDLQQWDNNFTHQTRGTCTKLFVK